jgi:hypothetical protein
MLLGPQTPPFSAGQQEAAAPASTGRRRPRLPAEPGHLQGQREQQAAGVAGTGSRWLRSCDLDQRPDGWLSQVRLSWGGIHHDALHPGRDRGIAVNAGGAVGLLTEDICVASVPSCFFDHVDVDPPQ